MHRPSTRTFQGGMFGEIPYIGSNSTKFKTTTYTKPISLPTPLLDQHCWSHIAARSMTWTGCSKAQRHSTSLLEIGTRGEFPLQHHIKNNIWHKNHIAFPLASLSTLLVSHYSSVTTMDRMFSEAQAFNQDLSGWDVRWVSVYRLLVNHH